MIELNDTVWATIRPSSIDGVGVFAIRDIPKNTDISTFRRKPYELTNEFEKLEVEVQNEIMKRVLCGANRTNYIPHPNSLINFQAFMNHSLDPNTNGAVTVKNVKKDEELTENYLEVTQHFQYGLHELTTKYYKGIL